MTGPAVTIVDSDQLRRASTGFDTAGDALEAAMTTLQGALAAEAGCWGADEPGETFAKGYEPAAEQGAQRFEALVEALHEVRTSLDDAATQFDATEAGNASAMGGGR